MRGQVGLVKMSEYTEGFYDSILWKVIDSEQIPVFVNTLPCSALPFRRQSFSNLCRCFWISEREVMHKFFSCLEPSF